MDRFQTIKTCYEAMRLLAPFIGLGAMRLPTIMSVRVLNAHQHCGKKIDVAADYAERGKY